MATTAQAFEEFLGNLKPTDHQKDVIIPARKKSVTKTLSEKFPASSDMPLFQVHLIGSAAKKTIIRPVDDIDVLAIFSNENKAWDKYRYNSQDFLYRIREAYNGESIQQVGARGQAIRIFFQTGGHVDIAPVFHSGGDDYLLPAGNKSWISTSPFEANDWFTAKNVALGKNLRPLIRLLKKWNREHSKNLKSFHLETVAANMFSALGSNQRRNLSDFFTWAPDRLRVPDPGGHSSDLSSYLTVQTRAEVILSFASAANRCTKALAAEDAGNHAEAKRLWSVLLGDDFPQ